MHSREICERYEQLYTGAVADILDEKGFRRQCLGKDLRPLLSGKRAAGFAYPALGDGLCHGKDDKAGEPQPTATDLSRGICGIRGRTFSHRCADFTKASRGEQDRKMRKEEMS